jgi:hypothetical protein
MNTAGPQEVVNASALLWSPGYKTRTTPSTTMVRPIHTDARPSRTPENPSGLLDLPVPRSVQNLGHGSPWP